jgi:hypothetical protein
MANLFSLAHPARGATQALAHPLAALGLLLATAGVAQAQTTSFAYTGGSQLYTVPAGVTAIKVVATGASGGLYTTASTNYTYGAQVQATLTVIPGEVLTVMVGGQGQNPLDGGAGGFNGGGDGAGRYSGGGGGATDLRRVGASTGDYLTSRNALLVAGGSGGNDDDNTTGGNGGTPTGGNATVSGSAVAIGSGATQTAPGGGNRPGIDGTGGSGYMDGAGGGGGYYGGAGYYFSNNTYGSGGGGSSFVMPTGSSAISYSLAGTAADGALAITPATINNALAFDGANDYVALPSTTPVPVGSSAYTIEAWIKPNAMGVYGIIGWGNYGSTNQVNALRLDANGVYNYWWANDLYAPTGSLAGAWHHVAATFDGTTRRIYIDGVIKAQDTPTTLLNVPNASNLRIGSTCPGPCGGEYFPGSIDEVRVYSVGLTAAQVQADMYSTTAAVPGSMVAYFNMDQGTAGGPNAGITSLTNQATTNPGTLTNFALTGSTSNWVRSFPTITAISPATGNIGSSVSVTGTNLLDATGFAFNGTSTTGFATPTSDLSATVAVPTGATTGPVSVASPTLPKYNGPTFTVTYPDLVVSTSGQSIPATTYNTITVTSGGTGTLAGNVTVNTSTTINSGGTLNDGCFVLNGAGTFTLNAGGTLGICNAAGIAAAPAATGAIQNTGTRSFSTDASYVYNGTAAQTTGTGLPTQVRNLSTSNTSPVTLSAATSVAQVLTVASSGNLNTAGNALTLLSSAAGTALVVNSGSGTVVGAATVQRYLDASGNTGTSGYRHYAAPVSGATVASLSTSAYGGGFTAQTNPAYNTADPNLLTLATYPNVFGYDESKIAASPATSFSDFDKGYQSPASTTAALIPGRGYAVQIGNAEKVQFTGTLNTGSGTIGGLTRAAAGTAGAASAGWVLVGNPYPAPLDWGTVASSQLSGVDAAAYVFQSTSAYAGRYTSFNNGIGANSGLIASGQGFFVRTSTAGTTGSIALTNANRATTYGATPKFQRTTADVRPQLRLSLALGSAPATVATAQDETFVYFEQGATSGFDGQYDAYKLANPSGYYLGTAAVVPTGTPDTGLSIDGRAPLGSAITTIPVWLSVPAGPYTLTATDLRNFAPAGTQVSLRDALTGTLTDLTTTSSYSFGVAANAPSTGRFTLIFGSATPLATTSAALGQVVASLYPNPSDASDVALAVTGLPTDVRTLDATLTDALGRPVGRYTLPTSQGAARASLPTQGLASGLYLLRLTPQSAQGAALGTLPTQRLSVR